MILIAATKATYILTALCGKNDDNEFIEYEYDKKPD